MTTAAERLKQLSGLAGVSAATMLLAIGTGQTAADILVSRSGLESATAAEHLLAETTVEPSDNAYSMRWAPPVVDGIPVSGEAATVEREIAFARHTTVLIASAKSLEASNDKASVSVKVDKERIARLDDELLWL